MRADFFRQERKQARQRTTNSLGFHLYLKCPCIMCLHNVCVCVMDGAICCMWLGSSESVRNQRKTGTARPAAAHRRLRNSASSVKGLRSFLRGGVTRPPFHTTVPLASGASNSSVHVLPSPFRARVPLSVVCCPLVLGTHTHTRTHAPNVQALAVAFRCWGLNMGPRPGTCIAKN